MQSGDHSRHLGRRRFTRGIAACGLSSAAFVVAGRQAEAIDPISGRVTIEQVQISFLISTGWGNGTLSFAGTHPFHIKGLGVGGIGIDTLQASGFVYRLNRLADFPGVYGGLRSGLVAGQKQLPGGIWMENPAGVRINLAPHRKGLSLSMGADGILITFDT